jgi:type I restriction enzyme S subunit
LDERIELLQKESLSLEQIARAIFKSWFVDFDPVRAKAEGREPDGMDAATAALFPCELVPAEEGMMPAGWNEGVLEDVCEVAKIGVQKTDMRSDENYVGLEHIPRESWSLASWGTAENLQSGKSRFQQGDILFGKLRPYFHKVCIAPVDGVCSTDILVLRPKNPEWMAFALCLVSSKQMIDYATRLSNGAKMPRSSWHDLSVYKAILPPESLAEAFNRIVEPIVGRIIANVYTAATLTALRDTLLPRLISGKLRVPEAEALLTAV